MITKEYQLYEFMLVLLNDFLGRYKQDANWKEVPLNPKGTEKLTQTIAATLKVQYMRGSFIS